MSFVKPKGKLLFWPITTDVSNTTSQSGFEANARNWRQGRENANNQNAIGFGLASHWLREWHKFCEPIKERSTSKAMQTRNYFRYSIENHSNYLAELIYQQIPQIPCLRLHPKRHKDITFSHISNFFMYITFQAFPNSNLIWNLSDTGFSGLSDCRVSPSSNNVDFFKKIYLRCVSRKVLV